MQLSLKLQQDMFPRMGGPLHYTPVERGLGLEEEEDEEDEDKGEEEDEDEEDEEDEDKDVSEDMRANSRWDSHNI